jgi:hypothetical protein
MHPEDRVRSVIRFVGQGLNDCEISRACPRCHGAPLDEPAYAYLLGLYLGDGCISPVAGCDKLRIFQDARYVDLISLARRTLVRVRGPQTKVGTTARGGCVEIHAHWAALGLPLPAACPWTQAQSGDPARGLATSRRWKVPATAPSRADPFGWVQGDESGPRREVQLRALSLHESLGGHLGDLQGGSLRRGGRDLSRSQAGNRLDRAAPRRSEPGLVHRPEVLIRPLDSASGRDDGTGRHGVLKRRWASAREGSSPSPGTPNAR